MSVFDGLTEGGHRPESIHVYEDDAGASVAAVARFAPGTLAGGKTFRQYRPVDDGWKPGLDGLELPLYGLPEVRVAVEGREVIFVVEGEACVGALREVGVPATTNAGGAGKWRPDHSESLRGADVIVLPDNDPPGRRHAARVAELLSGVARRVRVVELPGLSDHGDVVDWLRDGGTAEALQELVAAAPDWRAEPIASGEWPTPEPISVRSDPEPFPLESALPQTIARFAAEVARSVQVDVGFPAVLAPAVVSAAAGNTVSVRVSKVHVEPNLARNTVVVAASGERKSATFRQVTKPLALWTSGKDPEHARLLAEYESDKSFYSDRARSVERQGAKADGAEVERLRAQAMEARAQIPALPRSPLLMIGDVTSQMLVRMMHECGGGFAVMSADARHVVDSILGQYRKDREADDSVFLRAHGGDCIDRARVAAKGEGELRVIEHPSLALGLCLQPDKARALAEDRRLLESGMLQRLNLSFPRSRVGTRFESGDELPIDSGAAATWSRIIQNIAEERWRRLPTPAGGELDVLELRLGAEAMELRRAFANELEERQAEGGDLAWARGFASKAAGEAARLAGLFHLVEMADGMRLCEEVEISAETWRIAEVHQRWQLGETLRVVSLAAESAEHTLGKRVLEWARRHSEQKLVVARDLLGARIFAKVDAATATLGMLQSMGWVRRAEDSRQGGARWQVHPLVYEEGTE